MKGSFINIWSYEESTPKAETTTNNKLKIKFLNLNISNPFLKV